MMLYNKQFFNFLNSKNTSWFVLFISFFFFSLPVINFFKYGASITSDTIEYFRMANLWSNGIYPISQGYSPGYPLVLSVISKLFNINFENSSNLICFLTYFFSLIICSKIFKEITDIGLRYSIALSALILSFKPFTSIFLLAHADGLMLVLHLSILFFLFKYFKKNNITILLILSLILSVSLWVKNNNIVYFGYIPILFALNYKFNKKLSYVIFPLVTMVIFYSLYIYANGSTQVRLMHPEFKNLNLFINSNRISLFNDFKDFIDTICQLVLTPFLSSKIHHLVGLLLVLFIFIILFTSRVKEIKYLLIYFLIYVFSLLLFQQLSSMNEVNNRTLITANISLIIALFIFLINTWRKSATFLGMAILLFLNLSFTVISNIKVYKDSSKETTSVINSFYKKESLSNFKAIILNKKINPQNVYTNKRRLFSFSFNYNLVTSIPGEKYFHLGKMVTPDSNYIKSKNSEIFNKLKNNNAVVVLFDFTDDQINIYKPYVDSIYKVGNDIILF